MCNEIATPAISEHIHKLHVYPANKLPESYNNFHDPGNGTEYIQYAFDFHRTGSNRPTATGGRQQGKVQGARPGLAVPAAANVFV